MITDRGPLDIPDAEYSVDGVIARLVQVRKEQAILQAEEATLLAALLDLAEIDALHAEISNQLTLRSVLAEVGAALRVADRSVQVMVDRAARLFRDFPETHVALAEGRISRAHADVIMEHGRHIRERELCALYEKSVLPSAETETAGRLVAIARTRADQVLPRTTDEKHKAARAERGMRLVDLDHGMADLILTMPGVLAHGIYDRASQMAREVQDADRAREKRESGEGSPIAVTKAGAHAETQEAGDGDGVLEGDTDSTVETPDAVTAEARTLDNLRVDIAADLLLAGTPSAHAADIDLGRIRAHVQVTVPVLTLIDDGETTAPAVLDGVHPVDLATARALAGGAAGWDRVLTHPVSGAVLAVDRYEPSQQLRRTLGVRDRRCRFPGCRMPIRHCDLDHTHGWAEGGATELANLAHLCRRHHVLKGNTAWTVRQGPGGVLEWRSPHGRRYTDVPASTVAFSPVEEDLPPF